MSSPKHIETAATELTLALGSLIRRIRAAAPSELKELSWTQKSVIVRLDKDGPATAADLARAMVLAANAQNQNGHAPDPSETGLLPT